MNDTAEIHARPKIVGARIKRSEDPRLLTGRGAYTDDRRVPQAAHVAFRRSEQSHARIRAVDPSATILRPSLANVFWGAANGPQKKLTQELRKAHLKQKLHHRL